LGLVSVVTPPSANEDYDDEITISDDDDDEITISDDDDDEVTVYGISFFRLILCGFSEFSRVTFPRWC
jgi:hypothetical protein